MSPATFEMISHSKTFQADALKAKKIRYAYTFSSLSSIQEGQPTYLVAVTAVGHNMQVAMDKNVVTHFCRTSKVKRIYTFPLLKIILTANGTLYIVQSVKEPLQKVFFTVTNVQNHSFRPGSQLVIQSAPAEKMDVLYKIKCTVTTIKDHLIFGNQQMLLSEKDEILLIISS